MTGPARIAIVGAGRSRNGLGPFLARACERAGARVVAVAGRDAARARANAADLEALLGHRVAVASDLPALLATGIDALAIASPAEHHLAALEAAAAAGVPCLCEKPLVTVAQSERGLAAVAAFAARGTLLAENCQWPYVVPAVAALHGPGAPVAAAVALGLSPMGRGAEPMLADALPHLLSVAQAVVPDGAALRLAGLRLDGDGDQACTLALELAGDHGRLLATLHLRHCAEQPRPAWLEVDGRRIDRRIGADYAISFAAGAAAVAVVDPMQQLVADFVAALGSRRAAPRQAVVVAARLALYRDVLRRLFG